MSLKKLTAKQILISEAVNKITHVIDKSYKLGYKKAREDILADLLRRYKKATDLLKFFPENPNESNFVIMRDDWEGFKVKYGFKKEERE